MNDTQHAIRPTSRWIAVGLATALVIILAGGAWLYRGNRSRGTPPGLSRR